MTEKYITVHRSYDPIQTDMLGDLLRENGIAARVLGTRHGAVIGVGQHILQVHIEVPQSQAGRATDFLEAFFEEDGVELIREQAGFAPEDEEDDDESDNTAGEPRAAGLRPRRPWLAGCWTLLLFGGGHLYSQRLWIALVLAAGQLMALVKIIDPHWATVATGLVMFVVILALDFAGSQVAVRRYNRGVRMSPVRQLATGAVFLALAGAIGAFVGPRVAAPERHTEPLQTPPIQAPYQLVP